MKKNNILYLLLATCYLFACDSKNTGEPDTSMLYIKLLGGGRGERVNDAILTNNGEIIGVGSSRSFSALGNANNHIFVFKTDAQGNKIWQKAVELQTNTTVEGNIILPKANGGFVVLATASTGNKEQIHVVDLNSEGVKIASDTLPKGTDPNNLGTAGTSIRALPNGEYIALGKYNIASIGGDASNIITQNYMARLGQDLKRKYDKNYSIELYRDNTPYAMKSALDNDMLIGGSANNYPRLILISDELGIKWDFAYEQVGKGSIKDFVLIGDGIISTGITTSGTTTTPFIFKTNFAGNFEWVKNIQVPDTEITAINSIVQTFDGGYVLVGNVAVAGSDIKQTDIWVGKISSTGELEWHKSFGSRKNDIGKCVRISQDGGYVILGNLTYEENTMVALIRMDRNGNLIKQ
jgi:hypothetical protein